ncbi:MAG: hypothetical protein D6743_07070 [Calditrichaeota bacterium]|nr:MAG: hypothetical protein D6743_07070 [Calditrichota bacterium]
MYRQWLAPPSWSYVFKKARYFPFAAAWGYALSYARDLVRKSVSRGHQTGTWGPRYEGIDADLTARDLLEVCARQWVRSVERAMTHLGDLPADRVITVRYEDFVRQPLLHLERLARFLGIAPPVYGREYDFSFVSAQNIGKGFRRLDAAQQALILSQIDETLKRLDYLDDVKVVPASHEATWNSHASE